MSERITPKGAGLHLMMLVVYNYLNRGLKPTAEKFEELAGYFGVDADWLRDELAGLTPGMTPIACAACGNWLEVKKCEKGFIVKPCTFCLEKVTSSG